MNLILFACAFTSSIGAGLLKRTSGDDGEDYLMQDYGDYIDNFDYQYYRTVRK